MIPLSLDEIAGLAPGELRRADGATEATGLSIDSRTARPGDLFVAVGRGADFADEALAAGAAAVLLPENAFDALAAIGRAVRERSSATVVGITGSIAKTSTKDILAALCRPVARTIAAEGSQNNEIGLPLTLGRLEPDTEVCVLEMGMRGLGQIAELCETAQPQIGVITKIGPVHLELLTTLERVAQAKAELIEALPAGGTAVVPAGDPLLGPYLNREDIQVIRFGPDGDVELVSFTSRGDASTVEVSRFRRADFARPSVRVALQRRERPRRARRLPRARAAAREARARAPRRSPCRAGAGRRRGSPTTGSSSTTPTTPTRSP